MSRFKCTVCGTDLGWDRPSGVCSQVCLDKGHRDGLQLIADAAQVVEQVGEDELEAACRPAAIAESLFNSKVSSVDPKAITGQAIVNGRLVTEFRRSLFSDGSEIHPAGTLVFEQPTEAEKAEDYGPAEFGGILSETVTRFGVLFWDRGVFTPRV